MAIAGDQRRLRAGALRRRHRDRHRRRRRGRDHGVPELERRSTAVATAVEKHALCGGVVDQHRILPRRRRRARRRERRPRRPIPQPAVVEQRCARPAEQHDARRRRVEGRQRRERARLRQRAAGKLLHPPLELAVPLEDLVSLLRAGIAAEEHDGPPDRVVGHHRAEARRRSVGRRGDIGPGRCRSTARCRRVRCRRRCGRRTGSPGCAPGRRPSHGRRARPATRPVRRWSTSAPRCPTATCPHSCCRAVR